MEGLGGGGTGHSRSLAHQLHRPRGTELWLRTDKLCAPVGLTSIGDGTVLLGAWLLQYRSGHSTSAGPSSLHLLFFLLAAGLRCLCAAAVGTSG